MTYYDILGVPHNATQEQIKQAYRLQVRFFHPDLFDGAPEVAEIKTKQLNEAYGVLGNPDLRSQYDRIIKMNTQPPPKPHPGNEAYAYRKETPPPRPEYNSNFIAHMREAEKRIQQEQRKKRRNVRIVVGTVLVSAVVIFCAYHIGGMIGKHKNEQAALAAAQVSEEQKDEPTLQNNSETTSPERKETAPTAQKDNQEDVSKWSIEEYGFDITQDTIVAEDEATAEYIRSVLRRYSFATARVLVEKPSSGTILYGNEYPNQSELKITAGNSQDCVVSLKNAQGKVRIAFYVREGTTVTVSVPAELLYVHFACGDDWYGYGKGLMFGENTAYSKDDDLLDFTQYSWEYELQPVSNGNFSDVPSSAEEFF